MANGTFEEIVKFSIQNRRPDLYKLLEKSEHDQEDMQRLKSKESRETKESTQGNRPTGTG
jgi:hypothetical protein